MQYNAVSITTEYNLKILLDFFFLKQMKKTQVF